MRLALSLIIIFFSIVCGAAPALLTYQGRIVKSDGTPLEHSNVAFVFQITNPSGHCIIYQEQVTGVDMTGSKGVFDVPIGEGTISWPTQSGFSVLDAFNNSTAFSCGSCAGYSCTAGSGTYSPLSADGRVLKVQFHDGNGWKSVAPHTVIRSVPFAGYSLSAQKLGTHDASSFILKNEVNGSTSCNGSNQFLTWNATTKTFGCSATSGNNGGTVTTVTAASPLMVSAGSESSTPHLSLQAASASQPGYLTSGDWSTFNSKLGPATSFGGDVSGTAANLNVEKIKNIPIAVAGLSTGDILKYSAGQWVNSGISSSDISGLATVLSGKPDYSQFPTTCTAAQTLTFISPIGGFSCTNITLSFASGSAGNFPAISFASNVHTLNVPLASANGSVTSGTISNADYVAFQSKLASSTIFAGDISGIYSATSVDAIKGKNVIPAAYVTGQVLRYNGTAWINTLINISTDVTGVLAIANGGTGAATANAALNNLLPSQSGHANKVLQTNGSNVSWVLPSAGSVMSVGSGTGLLGGPITTSGTLAVDVGTTAGKILQVAAGDKLPGIDGSNLTNLNATQITSGTLPTAQLPALTGDISSVAGTNSVTIAMNAVTSAKILNGTIVAADMDFTGANSATSNFVMKDATGKFFNFTCSTAGHVPTWTASGFTCQAPAITETDPKVASTTTNKIPKWNGTSLVDSAIYESAGNVGIGTSTPGSYILNAKGRVNFGENTATSSNISFDPSIMAQGHIRFTTDTAANYLQSGLDGSAGSAKDLRIGPNYNTVPWMTLQGSTGNVGIGTVAPTEKLDVVGKIKATELCIGTDCKSAWPISSSGGTVTAVTSATTDIAVTNSTSTPVLTLNSGTAANQIVKLNASAQIPAVSGALLTNLNANNISTGTLAIARGGTGATTQTAAINNLLPAQSGLSGKVLQTNGTDVSWVDTPVTGMNALTGDVTASGTGSVAATIANNAVTSAKILNGTILSADMDFTGVNTATSSFVMKDSTGKFYNFACATSGHVPTWTASGFSCQAPTTGTVTSVGSGTGLTGGPITSTGTLAVDVGTTANKVLQLNASAQIPAVSGALLTNLNATNIATGTLAVGRLPAFTGDVTASAGTGALTISANAVTATELAANAVTSAKIADGTIVDADISGVSVAKIDNASGAYLDYRPNNTACTSGQVLSWDAANFRWICGTNFAGTVTSVGSGTGLTGGPITSTGTLAVDVGTTANKILQLNASAQIPAVSGALLTNLNATNIATGTLSVGRLPAFTGDVTASAGTGALTISANAVTATELAANAVTSAKIADGTIVNADISGVSVAKIDNASGAYFDYRPNNTACSSGQVLSWDATNFRWICGTNFAGTVTSVGAGTGLTGGPITSTGTLAVDVGTTANKILQLNASAQIPAVSGALLTNLNATNIATGTLAVGRLPAFTGDVTAAAGTGAFTITAGAVTSTELSANAVTSAKITDGTIALADLSAAVENRLWSNGNGTDIYFTTGRVGIGTTSPQRPLHILNGSYNYPMYVGSTIANGGYLLLGGENTYGSIQSSGSDYASPTKLLLNPSGGNVGIGIPNPSYRLDVSGSIRGYGITDSSDARLKKDIQPLQGDFEKVLKLQGMTYYWKDSKNQEKKKQIGVIAQEIEKVYPELVETDATDMKSVNYSHLVAPLIEAFKTLAMKVLRAEEFIEKLLKDSDKNTREMVLIKAENAELKERLRKIEEMLSKKADKEESP